MESDESREVTFSGDVKKLGEGREEKKARERSLSGEKVCQVPDYRAVNKTGLSRFRDVRSKPDHSTRVPCQAGSSVVPIGCPFSGSMEVSPPRTSVNFRHRASHRALRFFQPTIGHPKRAPEGPKFGSGATFSMEFIKVLNFSHRGLRTGKPMDFHI